MAECSDCRRILPDSETLYGGKCRICDRQPTWRQKAIASTPSLTRGACPKCKARPKPWGRSYCRQCETTYNREYQKKLRLARRSGKSTKGAKARTLIRKLGKTEHRIAMEKLEQGSFPIRSNPVMMGPTREFPGVDIDAIHRNPRWMKKLKDAA